MFQCLGTSYDGYIEEACKHRVHPYLHDLPEQHGSLWPVWPNLPTFKWEHTLFRRNIVLFAGKIQLATEIVTYIYISVISLIALIALSRTNIPNMQSLQKYQMRFAFIKFFFLWLFFPLWVLLYSILLSVSYASLSISFLACKFIQFWVIFYYLFAGWVVRVGMLNALSFLYMYKCTTFLGIILDFQESFFPFPVSCKL